MRPNFCFALLCTLLVEAAWVSQGQSQDVYLFDCGGWIQRVEGIGTSITPAKHVAEIDSTLPHQARDGCSIHAGWYDDGTQGLVLEVQTQAWMGEHDRLPTRFLPLAMPALAPQADSGSLHPPGKPDRQAAMTRLQSIETPFERSVGYLLSDGTTLLLQEVTDTRPTPGPIRLMTLWQAGVVSYRRGRAGATGRFALLDLKTRAQLGVVVSTGEAVHDERVVCFTPGGRIYLAQARNTLLMLDVTDPNLRSMAKDLTLDLHYTACASVEIKP